MEAGKKVRLLTHFQEDAAAVVSRGTWRHPGSQTWSRNIHNICQCRGYSFLPTPYYNIVRFRVAFPGEYWKHIFKFCSFKITVPFISHLNKMLGKTAASALWASGKCHFLNLVVA